MTHLNLRKCALSNAGFVALAYAFSALPNAISLDLKDNFIGEKGGKRGIYYLKKSGVILQCALHGN